MGAQSVTAGSVLHSSSAIVTNVTAGATLTAGQPVYFDTDGSAKPADADGVSPLYKYRGIAVNSASTGQDVDICQRDPTFTPGFTCAIGEVYIVGATAGAINLASDKTTGWKVSVLGVGISTTQINLFDAQNSRADVAI